MQVMMWIRFTNELADWALESALARSVQGLKCWSIDHRSNIVCYISLCVTNYLRKEVSFQAATGVDPGGFQGVRTPALLIRVPFLKRKMSTNVTGNA